MLSKIDKKIAESIILAQVASDGGKNIPDIQHIFHKSYPVWVQGYAVKDKYILKAINLINMSNNSKFRYFVTIGDIEYSFLVYFNYKDAKRRLQISFHTFNNKIGKWMSKRSNPRYVTEWDEQSSREACLVLRDILEEQKYLSYYK